MRPFAPLCVVVLLLAGCGTTTAETPATLPLPTISERGGNTAQLFAQLVIDEADSCTFLDPRYEDGSSDPGYQRLAVVWPHSFQLQDTEEGAVLTNRDQEYHDGDLLHMSGGGRPDHPPDRCVAGTTETWFLSGIVAVLDN